jgi:NAD(P)-dependent dehydrogenase (short-subunit alcohol dehydrogenase family)
MATDADDGPARPAPPSGRLAGRLAVITGASRGIGRAVALRFAAEGAHTILVARTVGGLEEADDEIQALGGSATLVPLDVKDGPGIDRLGAALYERWGKLDIVVGNAGMLGPLTPVGHIAPEAWDNLLAVNLTANWRLIRSLDPLLKRSDAGRAIFVSSGAARKNLPFWGGYGMTKAALEAIVRTYAADCADTKVRANLVNPGPIRTRMRAQAMPGEDPMTLPVPEAVTELFVELAEPACAVNGAVIDYVREPARASG